MDPVDYFGPNRLLQKQSDLEAIYDLLPSQRRSKQLGPHALSKLQELYSRYGGKVDGGLATLWHLSRAKDDTTKLLLRLHDGKAIETVIIPWPEKGRSTLCMSAQVGCRQGCKFCATGRMGRIRNLTTDELLAQLFFAKKICRTEGLPPIQNVVFMGMGESSDNLENVIHATTIMATPRLFELSANKIVLSTVAPTPMAFQELSRAPCVIAWSVHAANDQLRKRLVPSTGFPMAELRQGLINALLAWPASQQRSTMLEVVLIKGVNDSLVEANELAEFAQVILDSVPGCKLMINLIPYNDIGNTDFERPDNDAVVLFQRRLIEKGLYTFIRTTRGEDETAACGQLSTKKLREQGVPSNNTA